MKISEWGFENLKIADRIGSNGQFGTIVDLQDGNIPKLQIRWDDDKITGLLPFHILTSFDYIGRFKLYCLMSMEAISLMNGARGKMTSQAGHAFVHSCWDAEERFPEALRHYRRSMMAYKITVRVPDESILADFENKYRDICGVSLVRDAGRTVFKNEDGSPRPTVTCLGLGPIEQRLIGLDLEKLDVL